MSARDHAEAIALRILCPPGWVVRAAARLPPLNHPDIVISVPTESRAVALTLDDGPDPELTDGVLDVLNDFRAQATFFLLGKAATGQERILTRIADDGHELGNHTWCDQSSAALSHDEFRRKLAKTHDVLSAGGRPVRVFRPGGGWPGWCGHVATIARTQYDYTTVLASIYPVDVRIQAPAEVLATAVLRRVEPGSIIVLHEGTTPKDQPDRTRVLKILKLLLPELERRRYEVVTASELTARAKSVSPA
jgi:peptidoglycan-N-acetylglucosamine deacetylase